jgi:hypothetical protein
MEYIVEAILKKNTMKLTKFDKYMQDRFFHRYTVIPYTQL